MEGKKFKYECPHCKTLVAIKEFSDAGMYVMLWAEKPPKRENALQIIVERKCPSSACKRFFHVEIYCYTQAKP